MKERFLCRYSRIVWGAWGRWCLLCPFLWFQKLRWPCWKHLENWSLKIKIWTKKENVTMQVIEAALQGDWEKGIMVDGCSVLLMLSQTTGCILDYNIRISSVRGWGARWKYFNISETFTNIKKPIKYYSRCIYVSLLNSKYNHCRTIKLWQIFLFRTFTGILQCILLPICW